MLARHIIFTGTVQGVGFRFATLRYARRHDLTGFVRNQPDGTVEMFAQGEGEDIDACLADLKDYFGDYIRDVKITDQPPDSALRDFQITH
ncbi:MAG TPA: acylphosphatase [Phycisphaerales bacterium]|nr:acylphosphatase [Phycisphaerales bacterium]